MRLILLIAMLVAGASASVTILDGNVLREWAHAQQRFFQTEMAGAVHGLRGGDTNAWAILLVMAAGYGFVHAVGPGHGKYLIGGVGLGFPVSRMRLLGLAVISSLAQAMVAVFLVYGGFLLLDITARQATSLAENWLAPMSYLAIAMIGSNLAWRGVKELRHQRSGHLHAHGHGCCGHSHGPSPDQVARLGSLKEAVALIGSIAIRPCTGAIFLLVIAWQMDLKVAGVVAVLVMGLGTAALTSIVAISSVAARSLAIMSARSFERLSVVVPVVQILMGISIIWISLIFLRSVIP